MAEGEDDDGARGGMRFINAEQCAELHAMLKETGRQEQAFLEQLFGGTVRSIEEIQEGNGFFAAKSLLAGIKAQQAKKGKS